MSAAPTPVRADTTNRFSTDDHGNFMIFGNTGGFDCRQRNKEPPLVGFVQNGVLGLLFSCNGLLGGDGDSGIDFFWRSEFTNAKAVADNSIGVDEERSTAVFTLPAGAQVTKARLYWAAQRNSGQGYGTQVNLDRPGVTASARVVLAESALAASKKVTTNGLDYYQSSADITSYIQTYGSGAYRVANIQSVDLRYNNLDVAFAAWNIVVFYHLDSEPTRNLTLFDGMERVSTSTGSSTTVNLNGFSVPNNGIDAKLGVIAYEGDEDITGDQLKINGTALFNTYNPVNNFFNRTSTNLNKLAPQVGDLPQMSGRPASMAGYDADIVDISSALAPGAKMFQVNATTTGDEYYLGVFATAVTTIRPVFSNTIKTVANITHPNGPTLPNDVLEYTITTKNTGNDEGRNVTIVDTLPTGLTYQAGTLKVGTVTKTDAKDTDVADFNTATRTATFYLGTGATGTMGGSLAVNESATVSFRTTINPTATGTIVNQGSISAIGKTAQDQGATTPVTWPTGGPGGVGVGTPVVISTCTKDSDCPVTAPRCDTTASPPVCVCSTNADCPSGKVCSTATPKQCVDCNPGVPGQCNPSGPGGVCLGNSTCGCNSDSDCNGRTCDTTTHTCAAVNTDLSVTLTRTPAGTIIPPGTPLVYTLTASNNGQVPITGATLSASLNPALNGATWTCMGVGGAVCPQASGTGPVQAGVNLPVGGKLVYTYMVTTSTDPASSSLDFTGVLTPPRGYNDTNPADNTVIDSIIIGIPPMGPDLSITVTETPSDTDNSVNYKVQVTNHGPGTADGATVVYDVPPGAEITINAGDGWSCMQQNAQVVCVRTAPIPPGDASPITINVKGAAGETSVPLHIAVTGTDSHGTPVGDPNPDNNEITRTSMIPLYGLAGGGLGSCDCSLIGSQAHATPGTAAILLAGLFGAALLLRSSRRSRRSHATIRN